MPGPRTPSLFLLVALVGATYAGEPFESHDKAHGRPELARVGTIGDRPPSDSTLVVFVHADGAIVVNGKEETLDGVSAALARLRETRHEPEVLLRADARLPWKATQVLLVLCAEQRVYRVFHAVLPETGDEEGALLWPLPREMGWSRAAGPRAGVSILFGTPEATPAHLYWAMRDAKPSHVELRVGSGVPADFALRAADALFRAGVQRVSAFGLAIPSRSQRASDLRELVKEFREHPRGRYYATDDERVDVTKISVRLLDRPLGEGEADPMPAVERVRGAFAGPALEMACWAPEDEPVVEEPEPEIPEEQIVEKANEGMGKPAAEENTEGEEGLSDAPFDGAPGGDPGADGVAPARHPGGKVRSESVELGLAWLAAHQDLTEDGRWDCDGFMKHDPEGDRCDGAGGALNDPAATGLALLAFLGGGYTDRGAANENRYGRNVRAGARFLIGAQADDGSFGSRETQSFMYNQAIATLAMCELYWMTRNPRYRMPAQRGLDFLASARNPEGAWRYRSRGGNNDTSVTAWCVMALRSGRFAGLEVDPECFKGARGWIDDVTDPTSGRVGYLSRGGPSFRPEGMEAKWPAARTQAMTAAGVLSRVLLGEDPGESEIVRKGASLCAAMPPSWNPDDGSIDMDYWYFGTLALFQVGGEEWDRWTGAMHAAIVKRQHPNGGGARAGSWDPADPWGPDGGRIYATALLTMSLEVYYRYDRVLGAK